MGVRVLADKKHKFTILTTKPAIEASPTLVELAAGIEACSKVLFDGFRFTPTDSGTQGAKALCGSNEEVFTDENFTVSYAFWRYFLAGGGADPADDVLFAAHMTRNPVHHRPPARPGVPGLAVLPGACACAGRVDIPARWTRRLTLHPLKPLTRAGATPVRFPGPGQAPLDHRPKGNTDAHHPRKLPVPA